jgi:hypothetical protein
LSSGLLPGLAEGECHPQGVLMPPEAKRGREHQIFNQESKVGACFPTLPAKFFIPQNMVRLFRGKD